MTSLKRIVQNEYIIANYFTQIHAKEMEEKLLMMIQQVHELHKKKVKN